MRVAVFCGSKTGDSPRFLEAASAFGRALAKHELDLVYGGAAHGLMGAVASAVLEGGRHVIGVVPRGLARQEFAHPELSEHVLVDDLYQRKAMMAQKADAFVALPGGFGTLDELFDMLTAAQVGLHTKPIGLLDVDGYYAPLVAWISQALQRGFVSGRSALASSPLRSEPGSSDVPSDRLRSEIPSGLKDVLLVHTEPEELVRALLTHQPPPSSLRWIRD